MRGRNADTLLQNSLSSLHSPQRADSILAVISIIHPFINRGEPHFVEVEGGGAALAASTIKTLKHTAEQVLLCHSWYSGVTHVYPPSFAVITLHDYGAS